MIRIQLFCAESLGDFRYVRNPARFAQDFTDQRLSTQMPLRVKSAGSCRLDHGSTVPRTLNATCSARQTGTEAFHGTNRSGALLKERGHGLPGIDRKLPVVLQAERHFAANGGDSREQLSMARSFHARLELLPMERHRRKALVETLC